MGLDAVELVLDLEERFGVSLPDAGCSQVRTVADVAALVLAHMPKAQRPCPTAARFFEIRRAMVVHLKVPRASVRPGTALAELANPRTRTAWNALRRADRLLPPLERSPRGDRALSWLALITLGSAVVGIFLALYRISGLAALGLAPAALAAVAASLVGAQAFLARHAPKAFPTVGDLARATAPLPSAGSQGERLIAEQRVLEEVRRMVAKFVAVPIENIRPESRLVEDLRMD